MPGGWNQFQRAKGNISDRSVISRIFEMVNSFLQFLLLPEIFSLYASKVPCANILWLSAVISDLHLYKDHHDGPASTHLIQVTFLQT